MAMGRKGPGQESLFIAHSAVAKAPGHRFYEKLNELLGKHAFDVFVEDLCEDFYASQQKQGRRSIPPGVYFRMLLVGYFEGIESERGICWRCEDSLSLRSFLGLSLADRVPDHSSLSRIRTRLDSEVYHEVFRFILSIVEQEGLLRGRVVGVDSTYLRADASMKAIVRRETKESYADYLLRLAEAEGIEAPTAEDARRLDRKRKKRTSNAEWESKTDPDARITRLKDGRTRLAYKPEIVADIETGAILAAPVHSADSADTQTIGESLDKARENVLTVAEASSTQYEQDDDDDDDNRPSGAGGDGEASGSNEPGASSRCKVDVVADKGYYSAEVLENLEQSGFRPYIPEPKRNGRRRWAEKPDGQAKRRRADNARRRGRSERGRSLHRQRGEILERPFAHLLETGAHRRTRLRGRVNVEKRFLLHAAAANLGLVLRARIGHGTPKGLADALRALLAVLKLVRALLLGMQPRIPLKKATSTVPFFPTRARRIHETSHQSLLCSTGC